MIAAGGHGQQLPPQMMQLMGFLKNLQGGNAPADDDEDGNMHVEVIDDDDEGGSKPQDGEAGAADPE